MKKLLLILLAFAMVSIPAAASHANDTTYRLVGRELSPGFESGGVFYGALFLGKIFTAGYEKEVGYFSVLLNRVDEGVEECGSTTTILSFKLVMNFSNRSRLVLNQDGEAAADWDYDDPFCPDGCLFPGYGAYLSYLEQNVTFPACDGDGVSLIAQIQDMTLKKQRFGSWGVAGVGGATLNGWLVHTPLLIPAVFGTVTLQ